MNFISNSLKSVVVFSILLQTTAASAAPQKSSTALRSFIKAAKISARSHDQMKPLAPLCSNFSGKWTGECTDSDGFVEKQDLLIMQDGCRVINMWGLEVPINGTASISISSNDTENLGYSGSITYVWNDAQTRLTNLTSFQVAGGLFAGLFRSQVWLAGNQLRTKDTDAAAMDIDGGNPTFKPVMSECVYDKAE